MVPECHVRLVSKSVAMILNEILPISYEGAGLAFV